MFKRITLWLRQRLCHHEFRISRIRQVEPAGVECVCERCGKSFGAPFGISLPGALRQ